MSSLTGTQNLADKQQNTGTTTHCQYMSFKISGFTYAIPLSKVAEITPFQELNQMPFMPDCVEGLLDWRGSVLPVISLRTRMSLEKKKSHEGDSILMIDHDGSRLGFLVDQVESVITTTDEQQRPVSQLLEGNDGTWVREILLLNNRVILVLEAESLTRISRGESVPQQVADPAVTDDLELKLDEGLRSLLALSSSRKEDTIVPQLESVVQHTEAEVIKVLEKVELMLTSTDTIFTGLGRFKQEVAVSGMQGWEEKMSELDQVSQDLQMNIFDVIQQLQFQDIVRQKLENVLRHIAGMANVISDGLD